MEIDLKEAQKDTILGMVNEIFEKGEFVCPIKDPIRRKETVIGEATDYEKAIILAAQSYKDSAKKQGNLYQATSIDRIMYEALMTLFRANVINRLGSPAINGIFLSCKENWQLTIVGDKKSEKISRPGNAIVGGLHFFKADGSLI
jgi:hypothetical protein